MTVYFTSDLHLGDETIFGFVQRPWKGIEEHDAGIIDNINTTVRADDELYILGDFTLHTRAEDVRPYLDAIACKNRYLVLGNHDGADALFEPDAFVECCYYKELVIDGRLVCLSHYPMLEWNKSMQHYDYGYPNASVMLHGHVHSVAQASNSDNARAGIWRYDVGVDANGYRPVSFERIRAFIAERDSNFE